MRTNIAQETENRDELNLDGVGTQELVNAVQAAKSAIIKARPVKLLSKEKICCNRATD